MAKLNAVMIMADEVNENNYIVQEHPSSCFVVDLKEEISWRIVVTSTVIFDKEETVEDVNLELRMFYLGNDNRIVSEGTRLTFPVVENKMSYLEVTEPVSKKIFTKRSVIQVATVFPGEGQYVLMLVKKNQYSDTKPDVVDLQVIEVKYKKQ